MTTYACVIDRNGKPLMPCRAARARIMMKKGRAKPVQDFPFTIQLLDRTVEESEIAPMAVKMDPGSNVTGMTLVREDKERCHHAVFFMNLHHRRYQIHESMRMRANSRHRRRTANLRYRSPRYLNRHKQIGRLPPSLQHLVDSTVEWVKKLAAVAPISKLYLERVKFDTQKLDAPDISGVEYQHGELFGYELREYLLELYGYKCVYCGKTDVPLNIDHVIPRSDGGTNRVSNLVIACVDCNRRKGNKRLEEFVKDPELIASITARRKTSQRDSTAVNSTRNALLDSLKKFGLPVETGTGAQTKFNRHRFGVEKAHHLDALCVGDINGVSWFPKLSVLEVRCTGRGSYARTKTDKHGFPRLYLPRQKRFHGFATGDMVRADVPKGKFKGVHQGRAAVRKTGWIVLQTPKGKIDAVNWKYCRLISYADGYGYSWTRQPSEAQPAEDKSKPS